mmetsp:Transcript_89521/g.289549  ORF Transcript_89521/g.289549 Transcript_89521/m.289549 type:complete len:81 (-) Transcript_89521:124-366(-)
MLLDFRLRSSPAFSPRPPLSPGPRFEDTSFCGVSVAEAGPRRAAGQSQRQRAECNTPRNSLMSGSGGRFFRRGALSFVHS